MFVGQLDKCMTYRSMINWWLMWLQLPSVWCELDSNVYRVILRKLLFTKRTWPGSLNQLIWIMLDLPGLLFFSTYTLLVLFWAEICHQVSSIFSLCCLCAAELPYGSLLLIFFSALKGSSYCRQELYQQISWGCLYLSQCCYVCYSGVIYIFLKEPLRVACHSVFRDRSPPLSRSLISSHQSPMPYRDSFY